MKTASYFFPVMLCLSVTSAIAQAQEPAKRRPGNNPAADADNPADAEGSAENAPPLQGSEDGPSSLPENDALDANEADEGLPPVPEPPPSSDFGLDGGGSGGEGSVMGVPQVERDTFSGAAAAPDKPVAPLPDANEAVTTRSIIRERRERERIQNIDTRVFGSYRLNIAALKPFFEENDTYEKVYGTTSVMPALAVDYFFFDWYATLGLTFRMAYYSDTGRAVKASEGDYVKDEQGKVDLTLIPLQSGVTVEATPFGYKWLVASGWFGAEATYFQEVRPRDNESEASGDETSKDNRKYTNSFWRYATAFGGALNIRIDSMDPVASGSLGVMGLRAIYLSPYIEIVQKTGNDKMHLSRRVMGLGFTFESIR